MRVVAAEAKRATLGIPEGPYLQQASREGLDAFEKQIGLIKELGYCVKRVRAFEDIAEVNRLHNSMIAAELCQVHADWYRKYKNRYRKRTAGIIQEGAKVKADELACARDSRLRLRERLDRLKQDSGIDLWISPSAPGPAPRGLESVGDPAMNLPWTHAGVPVVNIPFHVSRNGLPYGLQLSASFMEDEKLVGWCTRFANELGSDMNSP
jgi:Asp-tRNA(Asn)/Glu-tRNA(Gln) amidotransferase A subunit family amidase